MGLVLRCRVFGVPTTWTTGTCSEKAGGVHDGLSERNKSKRETRLTASNAIDGAQFSDTEAGKHGWAGEIQDEVMTDVVTTAPTLPSLTLANPSAAYAAFSSLLRRRLDQICRGAVRG